MLYVFCLLSFKLILLKVIAVYLVEKNVEYLSLASWSLALLYCFWTSQHLVRPTVHTFSNALIYPLGLDAYNAFNVVDSLVSLARNYNRTVVFTIHQPRSNIVALFDQLLLMARGKMVYSGDISRCHEYLATVDKSCPPGFNLADFLSEFYYLPSRYFAAIC